MSFVRPPATMQSNSNRTNSHSANAVLIQGIQVIGNARSVLTAICGVAEIGTSPAQGISFVHSGSSTTGPYHSLTGENLVRKGTPDMVGSPKYASTNGLQVTGTCTSCVTHYITWMTVSGTRFTGRGIANSPANDSLHVKEAQTHCSRYPGVTAQHRKCPCHRQPCSRSRLLKHPGFNLECSKEVK